ncbi:hypothetical protein [Microbacterium kunmingense]|uniref:hypothetical protein n=1 Tax=Microbacterium kunmingense TaxID=2915939 RepID=UPI003D73CB1D
MSTSKKSPRRLVYGPAEYAGYDGIIVDADAAARFGRAAQAATLGEYVAEFLGESWDDYVAVEFGDVVDAPSPGDAFDYAEWFNEVIESPTDTAWDVAAKRVAEIVASRGAELDGIRSGGGSPGGNSDSISGPLEELTLLATLIDPERDGFTLERDDTLVDLGMSRGLYVSEG